MAFQRRQVAWYHIAIYSRSEWNFTAKNKVKFVLYKSPGLEFSFQFHPLSSFLFSSLPFSFCCYFFSSLLSPAVPLLTFFVPTAAKSSLLSYLTGVTVANLAALCFQRLRPKTLESTFLSSFSLTPHTEPIRKFCWFYFQNTPRIWPLLHTSATTSPIQAICISCLYYWKVW